MRLPESFIPSLRDEEAFLAWRKQQMNPVRRDKNRPLLRSEIWAGTGNRIFEAEFDLFAAPLLEQCEKRLQANDGELKIVTFGGGALRGTLELRRHLLAQAHANGFFHPRISLVDFSLTKRLANNGLAKEEVAALVRTGDLALRIGPLELRSLEDADQADVMVSSNGPFLHADSDQHMVELVEKAVTRLARGGKAFLHVCIEALEEEAWTVPARLQRDLGPGFRIGMKRTDREWHLEIGRNG